MAWRGRTNPVLRYWWKLYNEQTEAEQSLEPAIAALGLRYRTQHPVLSIKPSAILDFYFPDYKLAVEVDDDSHFTKAKRKKDADRSTRLASLGIRVYRCTNAEALEEPTTVASRILALVQNASTWTNIEPQSPQPEPSFRRGTRRRKQSSPENCTPAKPDALSQLQLSPTPPRQLVPMTQDEKAQFQREIREAQKPFRNVPRPSLRLRVPQSKSNRNP